MKNSHKIAIGVSASLFDYYYLFSAKGNQNMPLQINITGELKYAECTFSVTGDATLTSPASGSELFFSLPPGGSRGFSASSLSSNLTTAVNIKNENNAEMAIEKLQNYKLLMKMEPKGSLQVSLNDEEQIFIINGAKDIDALINLIKQQAGLTVSNAPSPSPS